MPATLDDAVVAIGAATAATTALTQAVTVKKQVLDDAAAAAAASASSAAGAATTAATTVVDVAKADFANASDPTKGAASIGYRGNTVKDVLDGRATIIVVPGSSNATSNRTRIQAALDAAEARTGPGHVLVMTVLGGGEVYTDGALAAGDNTTFEINTGLTIRQKAGSVDNMLVTKCYIRPTTTVVPTWTSGAGREVTVPWTAHGLTTQSYVWMRGAAQPQYIGVFPVVSVPDANTVVLRLKRTPTTAPTGTIVVSRATLNLTLIGGEWDYDAANNQAPVETKRHCILLGGLHNLVHHNFRIKNALKFCYMLGAISKYDVRNYHIPSTFSDGFKVYGPAFDGNVENMTGVVNDDFLSLQPYEGDAYAAYRWTFGDIIGFTGRNLNPTKGAGMAFGVYAHDTYYTDGIDVHGVRGEVGGYGINISTNDYGVTLSGNIGSIKVTGIALRASVPVYLGAVIDKLELGFERAKTLTDVAPFVMQVYRSIIRQASVTGTLTDTSWGVTTAAAFDLRGRNTVFNFDRLALTAGGQGRLFNITGDGTNPVSAKKISVNDCDLSGISNVGVIVAGTTLAETPHLLMKGGSASSLSIFNVSNPASAILTVQDVMVTGATNGIWRLAGAGTMELRGGNITLVSGSHVAVLTTTGTPVVNIKSDDIQAAVDGVGINRATGNRMYNTNAGAGTLGAAGPVVCQGTASGSWHLLADTTKVY